MTVSLAQRQVDLHEAERNAQRCGEEWLEARAGGRLTPEVEEALNVAHQALRSASSRLEKTRRRLEKVAA